MASFNYRAGLANNMLLNDFNEKTLDFLRIRRGTSALYTDKHGAEIKISGTDLVSKDGHTFSGTVTGVSFVDDAGMPLMGVSGLSLSGKALSTLLLHSDMSGFLDAISSRNDTVNGTSLNDIFNNGINAGNDIIHGGGGNDSFFWSPGKDVMSGGSGVDLLSFANINHSNAASAGIQLNVIEGTVKDTLSIIDKISGFEQYNGSRFNDAFVGSSHNETFRGLAGVDTFAGLGGTDRIDGGLGRDTLDYSKDALFSGGSSGINFDFNSITAGSNVGWSKAIDGFGNRDYFKNIEHVIGTEFGDTITTDGNYRFISGMDGVDNITNATGNLFDTVDFSGNFAKEGVIANLLTGEIANDGFGNAETYSGIGNIIGSKFADDITAGFSYGNVNAGRGDDVIRSGSIYGGEYKGGSGADTFIFTPETIGNFTRIMDYSRTQADVIRFEGFGAVVEAIGFSFSGTQAEYMIDNDVAGGSLIRIDANGDGSEDGRVTVNMKNLDSGDFAFV